jgi:hypothetical protein
MKTHERSWSAPNITLLASTVSSKPLKLNFTTL